MMVGALRRRSLRRRKAVSAILAGIIVFAALLTVGLAFFVQISTNEGNLAKANASAQSAAQAAAEERLSLTVGQDTGSNLALTVKNSGDAPATIVSVFVTSSTGQLVSTGPTSPYLTGIPYLNVSLPLTVPVGTTTQQMSGCTTKTGCNIGISSALAYSYSPSKGTVLLTVLTAAGNEFSAQYPPALTTTTSTSTNRLGGGSITVTSTSTTNSFTSTTITTSTSTDCYDCSTSTALGAGAQALQISSIVACAAESGWTTCEGTGELGYVLYGGPILLTVTVQNLATSQATNVQLVLAPTNGIPSGSNVQAQPPAGGQPSSCTAPQTVTTFKTYTCEFNGSFVGTGGTVTFAAYATGTISGTQITSAEAVSNPVQIGAFTSLGPWAPDVLHFYFTSKQNPSSTPADYITVDNQYVAYYISVTNTFSQPLTILGYSFLMDVRAGSDPTWFLVSGMNLGGTPSISASYPSAATCEGATPPATCIKVASNAQTQLTFAATVAGGSTMMWQNQFPVSPLNTLPDGESVLVDIFYYYNSQVYSQSLPFQSTIFDKASPTVSTTLSMSTIDANQPATDTATLSGNSAYPPTGQVKFTAYSDPSCTHQVFTNTQTISGSSATSGSYTPSAAGTYYFEANYLGDNPNNAYTTPCGLTGEALLVNPALGAPTIKATPSSALIGQTAVLSTFTSFTGGTMPYTCLWLQESPTAGAFTNLGNSFSCNPGDMPSTNTPALTPSGNWNFELQVTDNTGAFITSTPVTVQSQDFTVSANPTSLTVTSGGSTKTSTITVSPVNGFSGTVALSVAPVSGLTLSVNPASISGGSGTSTLSVSSSTPGTYSVTVTGTSGGDSHSVTIQVRVVTFGLDPSSSSSGSNSGTNSPVRITISTNNPSDIIYACESTVNNPAGTAGLTLSIGDSSGLTWVSRGTVAGSGNNHGYMQCWYAVANSQLTNDLITFSASTNTGGTVAQVFSVSGANTATPFDPNLSSAVSNKGTTGTTASVSITTTNANDLIVGVMGTYQNRAISVGSGFTRAYTATFPASSSGSGAAEYKAVSAVQSGASITFTWSSNAYWEIMGDAFRRG